MGGRICLAPVVGNIGVSQRKSTGKGLPSPGKLNGFLHFSVMEQPLAGAAPCRLLVNDDSSPLARAEWPRARAGRAVPGTDVCRASEGPRAVTAVLAAWIEA
jgi:hypothetical protein